MRTINAKRPANKESTDRSNPEFLGEISDIVDIDLHKLDTLSRVLRRELLEHG